jgi:hypothetical protein
MGHRHLNLTGAIGTTADRFHIDGPKGSRAAPSTAGIASQRVREFVCCGWQCSESQHTKKGYRNRQMQF